MGWSTSSKSASDPRNMVKLQKNAFLTRNRPFFDKNFWMFWFKAPRCLIVWSYKKMGHLYSIALSIGPTIDRIRFISRAVRTRRFATRGGSGHTKNWRFSEKCPFTPFKSLKKVGFCLGKCLKFNFTSVCEF